MLTRIAHTTDFSPESAIAFEHALRLAVDARGQLDILHVAGRAAGTEWQSFPHVREVLIRWGLLDAAATPAEIVTKLGVRVNKIEIDHADALTGICSFLGAHRPDLVVVATHGRQGLNRWLHGSISEFLAERARVPALLIGPDSRSFVDAATGQLRLDRVLLPVASTPSATVAFGLLCSLLAGLGVARRNFELIHIGAAAPEMKDANGAVVAVERLRGPVVETILQVAEERQVDLIAMATAGHRGFVDAFRGSTTSQVVPHAPCPVLALPLIGR